MERTSPNRISQLGEELSMDWRVNDQSFACTYSVVGTAYCS